MDELIFRYKNIDIYRYIMPETLSNMYVLIGVGKKAIIIDPNVSTKAIDCLDVYGIESAIVLLTHEHYDHISGVNYLREKIDINVICTQMCSENMNNRKKNLLRFVDVIHPELNKSQLEYLNGEHISNADMTYEDEYVFSWENINIKCKAAPGHSEGGCIIYMGEDAVFTGDNLTNGAGVIERWPGGSASQFLEITRPMIEALSDKILVFPGHGDIDELGLMRLFLEFYYKGDKR